MIPGATNAPLMPGGGIVQSVNATPFSPIWLSASRLPNRLATYDATQIVGADGDPQSSYASADGTGPTWAQSGAARPTLKKSWRNGAQALQFSGTQTMATASAITSGQSSYSFAWVGQYSSVAAVAYAFQFGIANTGIGFAVNTGSSGNRDVPLSGLGMSSDGTATTAAEVWVMTWNGTTRIFRTNGAQQVITNPTAAPIAPTTSSTLGAITSAVGRMTGFTGLVLACSGVWSAGTIAQIEADAATVWGAF